MTDLNELFLPDSLIRKSLKKPLYRTPPLWEQFPENAEEICHLVSVMPRQSFEIPDNIAWQSINYIERKTIDERLIIEWIVNCHFSQKVSPSVPELFYKIETLVIRPLIGKQGADLKDCLPIGTFEEIADTINFRGASLDEIRDAISFGGSIKIDLQISETEKKSGKEKSNRKTKPAASYLSYTPFNWRTSTSDFSDANEPAGNIFGENICYLFPTSCYVDVLAAGGLQIEKGSQMRRLSPLALRLLEVLYLKALVDGQGNRFTAGNSPKFGLPSAEIAELFPLKDESKFEELLKEFELLGSDQIR